MSDNNTEESDDGFDNSSVDDNPYQIPITNEIIMNAHRRVVTCISSQKNGKRFLSGSEDGRIKFFDFERMDSRFLPFREITPSEGMVVNYIDHSFNDEYFLVASANSQIKLYDKDGFHKGLSKKGDMYLLDLKKTFGHTGEVTQVHFSVNSVEEFISSSVDGTIRLWDTKKMETTQKSVFKMFKTKRGPVTCCNYNEGSSLISGCCVDSIQIFDPKSSDNSIYTYENKDCTSIQWILNDQFLLTRNNEKVFIYDDKQRKCIKEIESKSVSKYSNVIISPDNRFIVLCNENQMQFYDSTTFKLCYELSLEKGSWINWNSHLNQIFVGDAEGDIHSYFDLSLSKEGCLISKEKAAGTVQQEHDEEVHSRRRRKKHKEEESYEEEIEKEVANKYETMMRQQLFHNLQTYSSLEEYISIVGTTKNGNGYDDILEQIEELKSKLDKQQKNIQKIKSYTQKLTQELNQYTKENSDISSEIIPPLLDQKSESDSPLMTPSPKNEISVKTVKDARIPKKYNKRSQSIDCVNDECAMRNSNLFTPSKMSEVPNVQPLPFLPPSWSVPDSQTNSVPLSPSNKHETPDTFVLNIQPKKRSPSREEKVQQDNEENVYLPSSSIGATATLAKTKDEQSKIMVVHKDGHVAHLSNEIHPFHKSEQETKKKQVKVVSKNDLEAEKKPEAAPIINSASANQGPLPTVFTMPFTKTKQRTKRTHYSMSISGEEEEESKN